LLSQPLKVPPGRYLRGICYSERSEEWAKKVALIEAKNPTWEDLAERYFSRDATKESKQKKAHPSLRSG